MLSSGEAAAPLQAQPGVVSASRPKGAGCRPGGVPCLLYFFFFGFLLLGLERWASFMVGKAYQCAVSQFLLFFLSLELGHPPEELQSQAWATEHLAWLGHLFFVTAFM